jgi:pilus assembly protein FimV
MRVRNRSLRRSAAAAVHEQIVQWRSSQVPRAQAVASSAATADAPKDAAKAPADRPARTLGARLEIAPSSAAGRRRAGTQSGIEAGGEGEMLRQQLQETRETLAARDAEVGELKTRVAELEKLQQQQQQLLTMKDSALAAAQQTLAKSNRATSAPVATQAPAQPVPPATAGSGAIWLWSGLALVVVALVGWLLTRRKATAQPRRAFDTAALAAGIPMVNPEPTTPAPEPDFMPDQLASPRPMQPAGSARDPGAPIVPPPWHGGGADTATVEPSTRATINQQLEAAQTCLARGDEEAARVLLREVMDGRDPAAREVAARLLRDL